MCQPHPGLTTCPTCNDPMILYAGLSPSPREGEIMPCMGLRITDGGIEWAPDIVDIEADKLVADLRPWFDHVTLKHIAESVDYCRGAAARTCTRRCNGGGLGLPFPLYGAARRGRLGGEGDESWMMGGGEVDIMGPTGRNSANTNGNGKKKVKRAARTKKTRPQGADADVHRAIDDLQDDAPAAHRHPSPLKASTVTLPVLANRQPQTCFCEECVHPPTRYGRLDDTDSEDG